MHGAVPVTGYADKDLSPNALGPRRMLPPARPITRPQQRRAGGMVLITAAVALWNTVYLGRALETLRRHNHTFCGCGLTMFLIRAAKYGTLPVLCRVPNPSQQSQPRAVYP
jgi:Tn3 transposase DDE domain